MITVLPNGVQVDNKLFVPLEEIAACVVIEAFEGWQIVNVAQLVHTDGHITTLAKGHLPVVVSVMKEVHTLLNKRPTNGQWPMANDQ